MTTIKIIENGPAIITSREGFIEVVDGEKPVPIVDKIAICRCGKSEKQPYCDGSHKTYYQKMVEV